MDYTKPQIWHSGDWRQRNQKQAPYNGLEITSTPTYSTEGKLLAIDVEVKDFTYNPNGVASIIEEISFEDWTNIPIPKLSSGAVDAELKAAQAADKAAQAKATAAGATEEDKKAAEATAAKVKELQEDQKDEGKITTDQAAIDKAQTAADAANADLQTKMAAEKTAKDAFDTAQTAYTQAKNATKEADDANTLAQKKAADKNATPADKKAATTAAAALKTAQADEKTKAAAVPPLKKPYDQAVSDTGAAQVAATAANKALEAAQKAMTTDLANLPENPDFTVRTTFETDTKNPLGRLQIIPSQGMACLRLQLRYGMPHQKREEIGMIHGFYSSLPPKQT